MSVAAGILDPDGTHRRVEFNLVLEIKLDYGRWRLAVDGRDILDIPPLQHLNEAKVESITVKLIEKALLAPEACLVPGRR